MSSLTVSASIAAIALSAACTQAPSRGGPTQAPSPPAAADPAERAVVVVPAVALATSGEFVLGTSVYLDVVGVLPNSQVQFAYATDGEGDGPLYFGVATGLPNPVVVATVTADATGHARTRFAVPAGQAPGPAWIQAAWWDAGTAAGGASAVELRNFTVPSASATIALEDVTATAGFTGVVVSGNTHTGGCAWVDYNDDHWPDLFVTNGGGLPHTLWRNDGDGTFTDVSALVPKNDLADEDASVACADLDNDGDTDCIVTVDSPVHVAPGGVNPYAGGPNLLYLNNGDGTFTESAAAYGLVDPRGWRTITGMLADYDRDGFVDVYLGNWAMDPYLGQDNFDRLMHNDGGLGFTDVTAISGTDGLGRDNLAALWFDADLDGWPDLFVGNASAEDNPPLFEPGDLLYHNEGDGTFTDATALSPGFGDDAWAAMGADVADIDGDGDWDLHIADLWHFGRWVGDPAPRGDALYLGNGDGTFADNTCDTARICGGYNAWGTNFADFDRDGWPDMWEGTSSEYEQPELVYHNLGDGTFEAVEAGLSQIRSTGGAVADYDGDGALDVFVVADGQVVRLQRNLAIDAHHWLEVELSGSAERHGGFASNRDAIGATVRATAGGRTQLRRVSGGDSAHSQSELIVHFGLGDETTAEIEVTWPSGLVQAVGVVDADQLVFVDEQRGLLAESLDLTRSTATWSAGAHEVTLSIRSRFGGRTALSVDGGGPLAWNPETGTWDGVFAEPMHRRRARITSERGGAWRVPVTPGP